MEEFLPLMIELDLLKEAKVLQDEIIKLVKLMGEERIKIWPRYIKSKHLTGPMVEIYRCEDGLVRIPGEGHMPTRIYLEDEMMPPKLETNFVWKLNCLE
uniref:Uncharacterized protein n=1 Tax=Panagrolaimus sp. JU765 TaxID=591449 RepID=A0AC34PZ81_9BILA